MKNRIVVFILALLVSLPSVATAQTVMTDSLSSEALGRIKKMTVIVPKEFRRDTVYPVLYLLHGFGGNHSNWTALTRLTEYVESRRILVVMPDGENSWYVNSPVSDTSRFEDHIMRELVPFVVRRYAADETRMAIAGLSMGGYGALSLGLRHYARFVLIGALSASLDIPEGIPELERRGRGGLKQNLVAVFGPVRTPAWDDHDIFRLVRKVHPSVAPYIYLANGIQDEFPGRLSLYRTLSDSLRALGIAYEYHETPGRHAWTYWDREIVGVLNRLEEILSVR